MILFFRKTKNSFTLRTFKTAYCWSRLKEFEMAMAWLLRISQENAWRFRNVQKRSPSYPVRRPRYLLRKNTRCEICSFLTKCWRLKTKALTNSFKWLKKKHSPPDVWMMSRSCADGCFLAKWGKTILWFLWPPLSRWCVCVATSYEALGTKALVTSSFSSSSSFLQLIIVRLLFCHWVTCKLSLPCLRFRYVSFIFLTEKLTWFRVW